MVRSYKRKTQRQQWSEESMRRAATEVIEGRMGYKKAAASFGVPQTTLERKIQALKKDPNATVKTSLGPKETVFTAAEEEELLNYLHTMEAKLFGLTPQEFRKLAFQLAVKNKKHRFDKEKEEAGQDWLKGFLNRHKNLSLRKPEPTSASRAMGFNKVAVDKFFDLLGEVVEKYKLTADRVYNCDETGISVVSKSKSKVLSLTGRKQVGSISSGERGATTTVEVCFNAAGNYMPPMVIFPRKRMKPELMKGAPPGCWADCHPTGWMQMESFLSWFHKFIEFSHASKHNHVLLVLDGHTSHTKNINLIDTARENGVILLCFPPHCTHRLQPLDVAFMKPLSTYYDSAVTSWLRSHPGRVVTQSEIMELFGIAYIRAATMSTAINGFKTTGIWPVDRNVFTDCDFQAAETTNIPPKEVPTVNQTLSSASSVPSSAIRNLTEDLNSSTAVPTCSSSTSHSASEGPTSTSEPNTVFLAASPADILPIPHIGRDNVRKSRRRGKTAILTDSPYKRDLATSVKPSAISNSRKRKRKRRSTTVSNSRHPGSSSIRCRPTTRPDQSSPSENDEDTACLYCDDLYSRSTEGWIACSSCGKWAHLSCAGESDDDGETVHICALCVPDH